MKKITIFLSFFCLFAVSGANAQISLQAGYSSDNLNSNIVYLLAVSPKHGSLLVKVGDVNVVDIYAKMYSKVLPIFGRNWEVSFGAGGSIAAPVVDWQILSLASNLGPQVSLYGPLPEKGMKTPFSYFLTARPIAWGKEWKGNESHATFYGLGSLGYNVTRNIQIAGTIVYDGASDCSAELAKNLKGVSTLWIFSLGLQVTL